MKRIATSGIVLALALCMASPSAHAQLKKVAQTGLQFLKIDISARAAGMGGAYSMIGTDADAMLYNAAGMTYTENIDFYAARTTWISDIAYNGAGVIKNFGPAWGTVGLNVRFADYGEVVGTRVANNDQGFEETGNLDVGAYAVGLAYARQLSTRFSVGGMVSYATQHLGSNMVEGGETVDNRVNGLSYDFGTIYYPGLKSFRLGMSLRNFSPQFKYVEDTFELPLTFRIGFAADVLDFVGDPPNSSLLLAVDAMHPRDYTERLHFGAEYTYNDMFSVRAGYKVNYDIESFSLGLGVRQELGGVRLKLDYAYSDLDIFESANRLTLGASF